MSRTSPVIDRLTLATVTRVPDWHPEHATFRPFPVHAWVIHHQDGPVLFDTGIGFGNARIAEWYGDDVMRLDEALAAIGLAPEDIVAVVLSHLHFDHCGQHSALAAPVFVQAVEHEIARIPRYTIPEWAAIADDRLRLLDGTAAIATGVHVLPTPGHTPGHQSLVIESGDERVVLAGQCAFRGDEVRSGEPAETNLHDPTWRTAARDSLERVRAIQPKAVHLSHDPDVVVL